MGRISSISAPVCYLSSPQYCVPSLASCGTCRFPSLVCSERGGLLSAAPVHGISWLWKRATPSRRPLALFRSPGYRCCRCHRPPATVFCIPPWQALICTRQVRHPSLWGEERDTYNKHLDAFMAVADTGSFSKAAEVCHISRTALMQQIRLLEAHLGFSLFRRSNRGAQPTPMGSLVRARAEKIMQISADSIT